MNTAKDQEISPPVGFVSGGIGDQIYHLAQLRAIAAAYRGGKIDIACINPQELEQILMGQDWLGNIIDARPGRQPSNFRNFFSFIRTLRKRQYVAAYILHPSTSFKLATLLAGISCRFGITKSVLDFLFVNDAVAMHSYGPRRQLWGHRPFVGTLDAALAVRNIHADYKNPPIKPPKSSLKAVLNRFSNCPRPWIVTSPYVVQKERHWPLAHAAESLTRLIKTHRGTLFFSGGTEAYETHKSLIRILSSHLGNASEMFVDLLDLKQPLEETTALYAVSDVYVGVDSFPYNLALNCGLPAVGLFRNKPNILAYINPVAPLVPIRDGELDTIELNAIDEAVKSMLLKGADNVAARIDEAKSSE